jgi:imidazolonepropionase-like amidohydrolase
MTGGKPEIEQPNYTGIESSDDAVAKVRRVAEAGLDWIAVDDADKVLPGVLQALTVAARQSGIRLMGAATRAEEIAPLVSAGFDTIDYIDTSDAARYPDRMLTRVRELPNVTLVPTIGYHYRIHAFDRNPRLLESDSNYEFLTPAERAFVSFNAKAALERDGYIANSRRVYRTLTAKFRQLLATGALMATGTDVGSAAHFQAGGIWWELEAWRVLGAGSRKALTATTATAARVLGDDRAGRLKIGGYADFVLYSGDVEDGRFELRRVVAVAKAGVLFVEDGRWVGP